MKKEIKLSLRQLSEIKHALGGKIEYDTYRNYFNTNELCESWEELIKIGFAVKEDRGQLGGVYYFVTDKAIDVLK